MPTLSEKAVGSQGPGVLVLPPKVRRTIQIAAEEHGVTIALVLSRTRLRKVTLARQAACRYLLRLGFSQTQAGRFLGLHHTSVHYAAHVARPMADALEYEPAPEHWGGAA